MKRILPLLTVLSPIAAFLNAQSFAALFQPQFRLISIFLCLSLAFGIASTISLHVRMLEKKIKWATRIFIFTSMAQGITSILLVLSIFPLIESSDDALEGFFFSLIAAILSTLAAFVAQYLHYKNRTQLYSWTIYELSVHQRQFILLTISTLSYLLFSSYCYVLLEGWDFDDAIYWAMSTYATIGIGDFYPTKQLSKLLLPIFASCGILLVGSFIVALRGVILELFTLHLADKFNRRFSPASTVSSNAFTDPPHHSGRSPALVPAFSEDEDHHHSNFDALDLARSHHDSVTADNSFPTTPRQQRIYSISRSKNLPRLTIASPMNQKHEIIYMTQTTFYYHLSISIAALVFTTVGFSWIFSHLENWGFTDTLYFTYCILTTIGYGDMKLETRVGRILLVWYVLIGIRYVSCMF